MCGQHSRPFYHRGARDPAPGDYRRCHHCGLIALERSTWPTRDVERAYYQTHENRPDDPGYRAHLERLSDPLTRALPPPATGLDWGCGPQPVLADLLRARGYTLDAWDPAFAPQRPQPPSGGWDFISCTEVLEHLHHPLQTLTAMVAALGPGGILAMMTEWPPPAAGFRRWHYRRDPTHVAFYGPHTLHWIAARLGCTLELPAADIALFRRTATAPVRTADSGRPRPARGHPAGSGHAC
ncbi:class I SAM-dependent methyltransferase [Thioalkalivibrio sp. ALJ16]|uniref:class I SAM-dependent methyltransferase n=1 Tax=Thioalkalivibrio sp. ALJ16 TaxID=1158762 RepID=UPI000571DF1C|nr:class I SAM-dependent methyltransferase [Thioalkalivibrio sp. ALJ16]